MQAKRTKMSRRQPDSFHVLSLAKKFGRSELFGVGLLLLPMIFYPVLAFGGSEYEG